MAGSKSSVTGEDFYGAYDAQDIAKANADELGVQAVPSLNLVCNQDGEYVTADEAKAKGMEIKKLSGTKFRQMLRAGEDIPEWFAFKSVVKVLRDVQNFVSLLLQLLKEWGGLDGALGFSGDVV